MKKTLKVIIFIILSILICFSIVCFGVSIYLSDVKLDDKKLINLDRIVTFYDDKGEVFSKQTNGVSVTENENIPAHTKNAFIAIEDKRFYKHNGVDFRALARAILNNAKSFSIKEGASTISQQLIKNTHLSNEKTIKRKLKEIKLTKELERKYSKNDILEKYLNTIYFGNNCYGISCASKFYFNKSACDLDVNESAVLAAIIKAPTHYSPIDNPKKCFDRKNIVLREMFKQGYISEQTFLLNKEKQVEVYGKINGNNNLFEYSYMVRQELDEILKNNPYLSKNVEVFTFFNRQAQTIIEKILSDFTHINSNKSVILIDKVGRILAYYSDVGDVKRQLGSIIKPLAVYAPAIENDVVNSQTIILDEKTNFNNFYPSNFNDKYYGNISVKDSLAKSSNVCAVKILNSLGVKNAVKTLKKMEITTLEQDENLSLALGCTLEGEKLSKITAAYNVFSNRGIYNLPSAINEVKSKNEHAYSINKKEKKAFSLDTTCIMNDMLKNAVENGTAKKLFNQNQTLYAKTGTVGNKNGNTDAYIISYNADYTLGVWFGAKNNELMDNEITGGTYPALFSAKFWNEFYLDKVPPKEIENEGVSEVYIDKISYEQDNKIILADLSAPNRYKLKAIFKNNAIPKVTSTRFTIPNIENYNSVVNNNEITIELCLIESVEALIYRYENGVKKLVFDTKGNTNSFIDKLKPSTAYQYSIVPYFIGENKTNYGKEIFLSKIKTPNKEFGDDWWKNDFE